MLLLKKDIAYEELPIQNDLDAIAAKISIND